MEKESSRRDFFKKLVISGGLVSVIGCSKKNESEETILKENYPEHILKEKVNSIDVTILGVEHTAEFFKKYRPFLEQIVSSNDAVILEGIEETFLKHEFFARIGEIAYTQQKKIYQADPSNQFNFLMDISIGYLGVYGFAKYGCAKGGIKKSKEGLEEYSRKEIFKLFAKGAICTNFFLGSPLGWPIEGILGDCVLDDIVLWGGSDYRNIMIAEGINKICNKVNDVKKIVAIHGDAHSKPIQLYLKNPRLRKKRLVYLPYELISNTKVREYRPNENGWELSKIF